MKKIQLLLLMCVAVSCGSSDQTSSIGAADSDSVAVAPIESADSVAPNSALPDSTEVKEDSAPKTADYPQGAVATMTIGKDKIYLMPDGKVTSSNKNIFGSWDIDGIFKNVLVKILNRKYDGETVYVISGAEEAYKVFEGSEGEVSIAGPYSVIVKSEAGEENVDFDDFPSIPVTWLDYDFLI